jgi:hypothetical protein
VKALQPYNPHLEAPSRNRPPRTRIGGSALCLALAIAVSFPACKMQQPQTGGAREDEARAEDLLLCGDVNASIEAFRVLAQKSDSPEMKARALVGMARGYRKLGNGRKSLDALYAARSLCGIGPLRETIEKLVGDSLFANGDFGIARSHLEKILPSLTGAERDRALAKLHVCARKTYDLKAASRYLAEISKPLSAELQEFLKENLEVAPLRTPTSPPRVATKTPVPREPALPTGPTAVIPRGRWGASPVITRRIDPMGKISRLTIHHTGGPTFWSQSASDTAYEIRKIQRVHQNENHWADIGYHFIIDRAGRVWQGRPLVYQGAHAHGLANRGNIGIVVLGNYMRQEIGTNQIRSLRSLVYRLCNDYSITSSHVYTHEEIRHGLTECPGPAVTRVVQDIRRSMAASRHAD